MELVMSFEIQMQESCFWIEGEYPWWESSTVGALDVEGEENLTHGFGE